MYTSLGNGIATPALAHFRGSKGGRGGFVAAAYPGDAPGQAAAAQSSLQMPEAGVHLPSGESLSFLWSQLSTIQKVGIVAGGVAALGALAYVFMPGKRSGAAAPQFGALGPPR